MGLLRDWVQMAEDDFAGGDRDVTGKKRYEAKGNLIFLIKEDANRLPFTPENDKIAYSLEIIGRFFRRVRYQRNLEVECDNDYSEDDRD